MVKLFLEVLGFDAIIALCICGYYIMMEKIEELNARDEARENYIPKH